ncbi:MAG: 50S ribosomal protein L22 [Candidatus Jacksonbacteria bacterium RIFOXYA2_FULL_44_7]|uniref:Large ribosomal subunit protein uL22 n=1 Tax=Candidatus Jacksonbacteria bacterium RIFCSPLOWO2_02_FULL_44_20 TaxID=1798460 RepID=A0A1G2A9Z6_9BACT|nr:MAG: 50S ribosomal protein L22 [Parcubacteria group bacterium GW2011_GWC2_44_17]KKT49941.1 MAG: 50S ribosomal protein L22 [Parcubacteria group bacterium GW2011_GWF2_44_17]OGY73661.1 MAG: 50S ribosomal protein L22 [Candidatus Jacksonbacteria bacterium RIFCSPLOWO2_02_FULL_44_20]OGY74583.1 MAG: 50S ribosomal protein L22 [Candidatus Jacksonbacteria bacterium RIFOXYA2_FULL_44_7]OGY74614.1 MAG: 50S ribosomal protein L22 [Candidatus Jacksonbacteria bacterium RIFCSPLOWO2_12_FULL_44_15b]HCE86296.1 5
MEVIAKLNKYRQSPRKVRIVADLIRGIHANEAMNQLEFVNKRAALPIKKLLSSAIANAVNNFSLKRENLYVKQIAVDGGSVIKRWMPRAFGRASEIRKRTSLITIVLDEKIETREKGDQKKSKTKEAAKIKENVKVAQSASRKTVEILPQKTRGAVKTLRGFAPKIFQRKSG